MMIFKKH